MLRGFGSSTHIVEEIPPLKEIPPLVEGLLKTRGESLGVLGMEIPPLKEIPPLLNEF